MLPCELYRIISAHSECFLGRQVGKTGNLLRRRQGACASWHDAQPEMAERRSSRMTSEVFVQPFIAATADASPPQRTITMSDSNTRPAMQLISRERESHPNHHLTNNNGTWWCQITVHQGPFSRRLRFSLGTGDLERARSLRDRVFDNLTGGPQLT